MRFAGFLIGLTAALCSAAVMSSPEGRGDQRRLAAELVIMAGDVRRLFSETPGPLERRGIEKRVAGALASLPMLLRRARGDTAPVPGLGNALERRDWRALAARLEVLKRRHPFDARVLLDAVPTADGMALAASIHREACAGCHDTPANADTLLPAKNLAMQLKSMPREEFAARLWLGVRGDKSMALANPFSDSDLAALIAWYAAARPQSKTD